MPQSPSASTGRFGRTREQSSYVLKVGTDKRGLDRLAADGRHTALPAFRPKNSHVLNIGTGKRCLSGLSSD